MRWLGRRVRMTAKFFVEATGEKSARAGTERGIRRGCKGWHKHQEILWRRGAEPVYPTPIGRGVAPQTGRP